LLRLLEANLTTTYNTAKYLGRSSTGDRILEFRFLYQDLQYKYVAAYTNNVDYCKVTGLHICLAHQNNHKKEAGSDP